MKRRYVAALLLSAAALPAQAQVWVPAGGNDTGQMFLDLASIKPQGKWMKAWTKWTQAEPGKEGFPEQQFRAVISLEYYDCASASAATKQIIYYSDPEAHHISRSYSFKDQQLDFQDPIPGTIGQGLQQRVCAYMKR